MQASLPEEDDRDRCIGCDRPEDDDGLELFHGELFCPTCLDEEKEAQVAEEEKWSDWRRWQ